MSVLIRIEIKQEELIWQQFPRLYDLKNKVWNLPGGQVKNLLLQCRGQGFDPWSRELRPHMPGASSQLIPAGLHTSTPQPARHSWRKSVHGKERARTPQLSKVCVLYIIVQVGLSFHGAIQELMFFPSLVAQSFPVDIWVTATFGFPVWRKEERTFLSLLRMVTRDFLMVQ